MGHSVSHKLVSKLLGEMEYRLQANRKSTEGESQHPDRNAQFEYINARAQAFQSAALPVISVDTKKKELIGDFKNGGRELRPKGDPELARVHDFEIPSLGMAAPYGVYDVAQNFGWVNIGTDHDTYRTARRRETGYQFVPKGHSCHGGRVSHSPTASA